MSTPSLPLPLDLRGAAHFVQTVDLAAPPAEVFVLVSNPSLWHRWHPATRSVKDAPARSLQLGETVTEDIVAGQRRFTATWVVTEYQHGERWRIETRSALGDSAVTYRLTPLAQGCRFERRCDFRSKGLWRLLDSNLSRWMLASQARKALRNLQQLLQK